MAGAVSRTIVSPLERLKILYQIQSAGREEYKMSVWKALVKMGREEGWRGFMRGNGTNCIRIIPYSAVQFGSYNFYKRVSMALKLSHPSESQFRGSGMILSRLLSQLLSFARINSTVGALAVLIFISVCRTVSGRRAYTDASPYLRGYGWDYFSYFHLSARYRPYTTVDPVSIVRCSWQSSH